MLLQEGLTHIHSQKKPRLHFVESFALSYNNTRQDGDWIGIQQVTLQITTDLSTSDVTLDLFYSERSELLLILIGW